MLTQKSLTTKDAFFVGYTFITKHLLFCSNRYKVSHLPSLRNLPIHSLVLDARDRGCVQQEMVSQPTASCRHDGPQNTRHVGSSLEAPKTNTIQGKMAKTEPKQNRDDGNSEELFIDLI